MAIRGFPLSKGNLSDQMQSNPQPTTVQHLARSWPGKMGVDLGEYMWILGHVKVLYVSFMFRFTRLANLHKEFIKSTQEYFTKADVTWWHYDSPIIGSMNCLYLLDALMFKGFHVHPARFHHSPFFVVAGSEMFTIQTCCCWFKNPINAMLHKALIWHFKHMRQFSTGQGPHGWRPAACHWLYFKKCGTDGQNPAVNLINIPFIAMF